MATVRQHYDQVLSDVYSWMFGGFKSGIDTNAAFFQKHGISPAQSGIAIDLGAGCGFQSIPLAQAGFSVTAIDLDDKLLKELADNSLGLDISIVRDDLVNFDKYTGNKVEIIVCMTDTLIHLDSKDTILSLFYKVYDLLEEQGRFIVTFRDLSAELSELDRFIPVRSDSNMIFTCFLEYEQETVKVHDIIYKKEREKWCLYKSFYRKLKLSGKWVEEQLSRVGFAHVEFADENGLVTVLATK